MKKRTHTDDQHSGQQPRRARIVEEEHRADPDIGPTNPVYEEYDQGSQGPPNKPGQYDRSGHDEQTDTLGGQGGQGPDQGRGANPGEIHPSRERGDRGHRR
jgi:hypothetical protein